MIVLIILGRFVKNEIFIGMKEKNKKIMIEHLDIDENFYIEKDKVKLHNELSDPQEGTWDDVWGDVIKIIKKAKEDDEKYNFNNIR